MAKFEHIKGAEGEKLFAKGRVHGATREYMGYLQTLKKEGGVGILRPTGKENPTTLRNRIRRAAELQGIEVKTQKDGNELLVKVVK